MDKISIIIPIYNSEKTLQQCIDSILLQNYNNLEIILINDGSTDNSHFICEDYSHKFSNIIYIKKENSGVSDSRNKGIEVSTGKYIMFVDSDDYIEKETIFKMVSYIENADLVISNFDVFGRKTNNCKKYYKTGKMCVIDFFDYYLKNYNSYILNVPWNKLYRRDLIINNNIVFNKNLELGEDLVFNLNYFSKCSDINIVNDKLYNYYISDNGLSFKKRPISFYNINENRIYSIFVEVLKNLDIFNKHISSINNLFINRLFFDSIIIFKDDDNTYQSKIIEIDKITKFIKSNRINKKINLHMRVYWFLIKHKCLLYFIIKIKGVIK